MQFPILIGLRRSYLLLWLLLLPHLLAVLVLCLPAWPRVWVGAGLGLILISLLWNWQHWPPSCTELRLHADGRMESRLSESQNFAEALLQPGAKVHPWLTVLRVKVSGRKILLVVAPDSATAEARRRLRLWLRWRHDPLASSSDDL